MKYFAKHFSSVLKKTPQLFSFNTDLMKKIKISAKRKETIEYFNYKEIFESIKATNIANSEISKKLSLLVRSLDFVDSSFSKSLKVLNNGKKNIGLLGNFKNFGKNTVIVLITVGTIQFFTTVYANVGCHIFMEDLGKLIPVAEAGKYFKGESVPDVERCEDYLQYIKDGNREHAVMKDVKFFDALSKELPDVFGAVQGAGSYISYLLKGGLILGGIIIILVVVFFIWRYLLPQVSQNVDDNFVIKRNLIGPLSNENLEKKKDYLDVQPVIASPIIQMY